MKIYKIFIRKIIIIGVYIIYVNISFAGQILQNENGLYGITNAGKLVTNDYVTYDSDGDGLKEYFYCNKEGYIVPNIEIPSTDGSSNWMTNWKGQVVRKNDNKIEIDIPRERVNEFIGLSIYIDGNYLYATVRNNSKDFTYHIRTISAYNGITYVTTNLYDRMMVVHPQEKKTETFQSVFSSRPENYSTILFDFDNDKYFGYMFLKLYTNGYLELVNSY